MISSTTGALVEASTVAGAQLRGAAGREVQSLARFGHLLGLAMQVRDDVAEIVGDAESIGKEIGGDIRRGKKRLPLILAIERMESSAKQVVSEALRDRQLASHDVASIVRMVKDSGAIEECLARIGTMCDEACQALDELTACRATVALRGIAKIVKEVW